MIKKSTLLVAIVGRIFILFTTFNPCFSMEKHIITHPELMDRIVAIVGDEIITQSELTEASLMMESPFLQQTKTEILNQLIERKLLLVQAAKETLEVKFDELQSAVESAMLDMRGRFPSDSTYKLELEKADLTEIELKEKYTKQIKETLLIQKLFQQKFGKKLMITDIEALNFYNTHKDSIPQEPQAIKALWVNVPYSLSDKAIRDTERKAEKVLELTKKESFAKLVTKYCDMPELKAQGGNIGTVDIEDLSPEFRTIVNKLKEGEIGIVKTPPVYHVIRVDAKYRGRATLRGIAIMTSPSAEDSASVKRTAEFVKESLIRDEVFELPGTKLISYGEKFLPIWTTPFTSIDDIIIDEIYSFHAADGYQILKPIETREERFPEWETIRNEVKNFLYERRLTTLSRELIEKLKQEIYTKSML